MQYRIKRSHHQCAEFINVQSSSELLGESLKATGNKSEFGLYKFVHDSIWNGSKKRNDNHFIFPVKCDKTVSKTLWRNYDQQYTEDTDIKIAPVISDNNLKMRIFRINLISTSC